MIQSQQVLEWMAMGEAEGVTLGEVKGMSKSLLNVLAARFPPGAPRDLEEAIHAAANCEQLHSWLRFAVKTDSLDAFRQAAWL